MSSGKVFRTLGPAKPGLLPTVESLTGVEVLAPAGLWCQQNAMSVGRANRQQERIEYGGKVSAVTFSLYSIRSETRSQ